MKKFFTLFFICLFILYAGTEVNAQSPTISFSRPGGPPGSTPLSPGTNVSVNTDIQIIFNDPTVTFIDFVASFHLFKAGAPTPDVSFSAGVLQYLPGVTIGGPSLTIPNSLLNSGSPLEPNTTYNIRIDANFVAGFAGVFGTDWSFTTAAPPPSPPTITSTTPAHTQQSVPLNQQITINFSENVNTGSGILFLKDFGLNSVAFIMGESSLISPTVDGKGITFSLDDMTKLIPLQYGTYYTIEIPSGFVTSQTGLPNAALPALQWYFQTELSVPPTIVSRYPALNSTGIPLNPNIEINYSVNVSAGTGVPPPMLYLYEGVNLIGSVNPATLSIGGFSPTVNIPFSFIIFNTPTEFLKPDTEYRIIITKGFVVDSSTGVESDAVNMGSWIFETGPPPALTVTSSTPAHNSVNISVNTDISITFNKDIAIGSIGSLRIYEDGVPTPFVELETWQLGVANIVPNGRTITIPNNIITLFFGNFKGSTKYIVEIDEGWVECALTGEQCERIDNNSWVFTTEMTIISRYPGIGETNIPTDTSLEITFSDNIAIGTGILRISLGLTTILQINASAASSYIVGNKLTIPFSAFSGAGLVYNQTYNVSMPAGFVVSPTGNNKSELWNFTTEIFIPLIIESVSPPDNTQNISTLQTFFVEFSKNIRYKSGGGDISSNPRLIITSFQDAASNVVPTSDYLVSYDPVSYLLTINVIDNLQESTDYIIVLNTSNIEDYSGNAFVGGLNTTLNYRTDTPIRWKVNAASSNWGTYSNWEGEEVPSGESVYIPISNFYPTIATGSRFVQNLTIASGAELHQTGGTLNVSGVFQMESAPNLSEVNASYIKTGGTLNVDPRNVKIRQIMSVNNQSYIISSPVSGATRRSIGAPAMQRFDNTTGNNVSMGLDDELFVGQGYMARWTSATIRPLVFTGPINQGNVVANVIRTDGAGYGWNLVGNPYPTAVDWDALIINNVEDGFWMWDHSTSTWGTYGNVSGIALNNGSSQIPSNHGIQIKVIQGVTTGSITFTPSAMEPNSVTYLRDKNNAKVPYVKLAGVKNDMKDEFAIALTENMAPGINYDMEKKLSSNENFIEFYIDNGDMLCAIKGYEYDKEIEIPIGFKTEQVGDFSIELIENTAGITVLLIDNELVNKEITNLSEEISYSFTVGTAGNNNDRFILRLIGELDDVGIENKESNSLINVYSENKIVKIDVPHLPDQTEVEFEMFDISGQLINKGFLKTGTTNSISVLNTGIYLLSIKDLINNENFKVIVK